MYFQDKNVLVTGGGRGIGRTAALEFANGGANVAVADIDKSNANMTAEDIHRKGRRAVGLKVDVGNIKEINLMVEETVSSLGGIDIFFNNAGITKHIDFFDIEEADWDQINRVNAKGAFFCIQRVAKQMVAQGRGGRIISMASIAGRGYRRASNSSYAASKGAVIAMTYSASSVLAANGINVNAICPGIVRTDMLKQILGGRSDETGTPGEDLLNIMTEEIPTGRANEPEDIAAMAVFLAGPGGRNITGQAFNVDGGLIMS